MLTASYFYQGSTIFSDFVHDALRFCYANHRAIDSSIPHIYLSALSFSPSNSFLQRYRERCSNTINIPYGRQSNWPPEFATLQLQDKHWLDTVAITVSSCRSFFAVQYGLKVVVWTTTSTQPVMRVDNRSVVNDRHNDSYPEECFAVASTDSGAIVLACAFCLTVASNTTYTDPETARRSFKVIVWMSTPGGVPRVIGEYCCSTNSTSSFHSITLSAHGNLLAFCLGDSPPLLFTVSNESGLQLISIYGNKRSEPRHQPFFSSDGKFLLLFNKFNCGMSLYSVSSSKSSQLVFLRSIDVQSNGQLTPNPGPFFVSDLSSDGSAVLVCLDGIRLDFSGSNMDVIWLYDTASGELRFTVQEERFAHQYVRRWQGRFCIRNLILCAPPTHTGIHLSFSSYV